MRTRLGAAGWFGLAVVAAAAGVAVAAPLVIPAAATNVVDATGPPLASPSLRFPFGTDENGLSVFTLTLWGTRQSLLVAVLATTFAVGVGAPAAVISGHFRGPAASAVDTVTEWFLVLPGLPLALAVGAVLAPGATSLVLALALTSWAGVARIIRAAVLGVEAQPFVDRARALGAGHWHLVARHVFPAVVPVVVATATLTVGNNLLAEAALAFLGLGDPNEISWGSMLSHASTSGAVTAGAWWYLLAPGLAITLIVLAFAACGRALEHSLQPVGVGRG